MRNPGIILVVWPSAKKFTLKPFYDLTASFFLEVDTVGSYIYIYRQIDIQDIFLFFKKKSPVLAELTLHRILCSFYSSIKSVGIELVVLNIDNKITDIFYCFFIKNSAQTSKTYKHRCYNHEKWADLRSKCRGTFT